MPTQLDLRQSVLRSALAMAGSAAGATADTLFPLHDAEIAKLFQDRNVILTDGGTITFTGTQAQFTDNLYINVEQQLNTAAAPTVINLGSTSQTFTYSGDILYAVINRTAGTGTLSIASPNNPSPTYLPAVLAANQEVFVIAVRKDAADGTQRLYFRNGAAFNAGQSARLGSAGSGGTGSGIGDDLDSLQFQASFSDLFTENDTNSISSINSSGTNATFNAAKSIYAISYDASKTATSSGTTVTMSAAPAYTVAIGDIIWSGFYARKITAVASQTSYTIEAAFPTALAASACTVSQCVYTKDVYNFAVDGVSLATEFGTATFSEIMVDYKDNATTGSNTFTPGVGPYIAWTGSNDLVNFTNVNARNTLGTTQVTSSFLPSAGTSLYLRFFSNATSGSGVVNLIMYKAFLQKAVNAAGGGVINSAYAFTNGVGTPVNCTTSVVGGKSVITLNFSYAVGVNSGNPYGSIDVYLNGQMIPRFINSTLTPDASYTEYSSKAIQLDKDYSALNISVEVLQRVSVVDASTTNTTYISQIQEATNYGFNGFINTQNVRVATAVAGTPATGTFYSTIINRANIVDISQDLRASFGIERIVTQTITQLQTESGPNGESVFSTPNDTNGLIRFVGQWSNYLSTPGQNVQSSLNLTDYVEITFYGTGLNLLNDQNSTVNMVASVDGGSEGSNIFGGATIANTINIRNYSANMPIPVVSGLTLGVHTVKLRNNSTSIQAIISGFEVVNANSTTALNVNPGISYIGGQKLSAAAATALTYNSTFDSGTLGTTGGHVVVYQTAAGTVSKAVTPTGSPSYLTSVSHTNEELVRSINFREFSASRSDDFSQSLGNGTAAFTLDDGTTTLVGSNVSIATVGSTTGLTDGGVTNSFMAITFIGTGLDIFCADQGTTIDTHTLTVDGVSQGTITAFGVANAFRTRKLVSGLPYGTHVVRITRTTTSGSGIVVSQFNVYQPKIPSIPSGAVQLADYNVVANYVANATAGVDNIATGVLRKMATREFIYSGTFSTPGVNTPTIGGYVINTATAASYVQYTFFGSGFEFRFDSGSTMNATVTVDGSTNLSAFTTSMYGPTGTFTASTGVIAATSSVTNSGISVNGLALGLHTVKITYNSGNSIDILAFDVVTPIYSTKSNIAYDEQNSLMVGSNALSDDRKTSPVATLSAKKNISQAFGIVSSPTTTSTTPIPLPDMSVQHSNSTGRIRISYGCVFSNNTSTDIAAVQAYIDGVPVGNAKEYQAFTSGGQGTASDSFVVPVSPGNHEIYLYWYGSGGTSTANNLQRNLLVEEA